MQSHRRVQDAALQQLEAPTGQSDQCCRGAEPSVRSSSGRHGWPGSRASLQAVHGVFGQQAEASALGGSAARGQHGVGCGVHILRVLHLVSTAVPVDVEAGDSGIGGQDIPLELRRRRRDCFYTFLHEKQNVFNQRISQWRQL